MAVVMNPELHLWTIPYWSSGIGMGCKAFSVWASPQFLSVAKEIKYDEGRVQKMAKAIITDAGWDSSLYVHQRFLKFGEYGLMHFNVPGNACGLDFNYSGNYKVLERGANYLPHNVDHSNQQSTLLAIWLMWANFVECEVYNLKEKKEVGQ